jgi:tripartite-type tricarboxylate transporter receptor subunit TctC
MQVVLARADVKEQLGRYAFEPQSSSPEEMSVYLKEQLEVWRRTVQELGIVRD